MKLQPKLARSVLVLALAASMPGLAVTQPAARTESAQGFNFAYRFSGEARLLPLQVFDDGKNTYFQFSSSLRVLPAVIADTGPAQQVVKFRQHGPYYVADGVARAYLLRFNSLTANVVQEGQQPVSLLETERPMPSVTTGLGPEGGMVRAVARTGPPPTYGPTAPVIGDTPPPGGALSVAAQSQATVRVPFKVNSGTLDKAALAMIRSALQRGEVVRATVTARDDLVFREGVATQRGRAIRDVLVRFGVPAGAISVREGFPRDEDGAKRASSDLIVTYAPRPVAAVHASAKAHAPATVREALSMVEMGLASLMRLGAIPDETGRGFFATLLRTVSNQPSGQEAAPAIEEQWVMTTEDGSAKVGLERWAAKAGYELDWLASVDFPINTRITFKGNFFTALGSAVDQMKKRQADLSWKVDGKRIVVTQG